MRHAPVGQNGPIATATKRVEPGQPTSESERARAAESSVELATGVRHILEVNKRMNRRLTLVLKPPCSRHITVVVEVPSFLSHAVELGKETMVARKSFGDFEPVESKHGGCSAPNNENWTDDLAPPKAAAWWGTSLDRGPAIVQSIGLGSLVF